MSGSHSQIKMMMSGGTEKMRNTLDEASSGLGFSGCLKDAFDKWGGFGDAGAGGFGEVHVGELHGEQVAIKYQVTAPKVVDGQKTGIDNESKIYALLKEEPGFPRVLKEEYSADGKGYLAMERLGMSLESLLEVCDNQFSLKTILMIADQLLTRLEALHSKGFLHRDLKPGNVLIGYKREDFGTIFLIDFGIATQYADFETGKIFDRSIRAGFAGTSMFASRQAHAGYESRGGELYSLYYLLMYLLRGQMCEWSHLPALVDDDAIRAALTNKLKCDTAELPVSDDVPEAFQQFRTYVDGLEFEEKPDYSYLRRLFRELFFSKGYSMDGQFDWIPALTELNKYIGGPYRQFIEQWTTPEAAGGGCGDSGSATVAEEEKEELVESLPMQHQHQGILGEAASALTAEEEKRVGLFQKTFGVVSVGVHHMAFPRDHSMCDVERIRQLEGERENLVVMIKAIAQSHNAEERILQDTRREKLAAMLSGITTEIQELSQNIEGRRVRCEGWLERVRLKLKQVQEVLDTSPELERFNRQDKDILQLIKEQIMGTEDASNSERLRELWNLQSEVEPLVTAMRRRVNWRKRLLES